jgi:hypothetical protein
MADHHVLADIAAKIAEIAGDCFDRPAATRLRELHAHLEQMLALPPVADAGQASDDQTTP